MTSPPYESPRLDDIARRVCAEMVMAGPRGMTVREVADRTGANAGTVGNVLRGKSVAYGDRLFIRAGKQGNAWLWRIRWGGQ